MEICHQWSKWLGPKTELFSEDKKHVQATLIKSEEIKIEKPSEIEENYLQCDPLRFNYITKKEEKTEKKFFQNSGQNSGQKPRQNPLFINKRFVLNEMFQWNASKFAIFYV